MLVDMRNGKSICYEFALNIDFVFSDLKMR